MLNFFEGLKLGAVALLVGLLLAGAWYASARVSDHKPPPGYSPSWRP